MKKNIFIAALMLLIAIFTGKTFAQDIKNIVVIQTNMGNIELQLFQKDAPITYENFINKIKEKAFIGTTFHRLVPDFVIQGGDPYSKDNDISNDGYGGGEIKVDPRILSNDVFTVSMASSCSTYPISSQSDCQFFINLKKNTNLDKMGFIPFAKVIKGTDVVEKIAGQSRDDNDRPLKNITINNIILK